MVSYEFRFPRRMRITLWINKEMEREKLLPPFSAPLTLMAGHVETLNLKQVLRKIWMEAREGVRNFCLRCFFLWSSKVKGASFNRNATFQMFECLRVTRGCGTSPSDRKIPFIPDPRGSLRQYKRFVAFWWCHQQLRRAEIFFVGGIKHPHPSENT